jgi:hypothetical protein
VYVTGGALNLLKNVFYAISWKFQKNGQPTMRTVAEDSDICIAMTQGANHTNALPVTWIEVTEGNRTIGVCLAPDGTNKTQYAFRLKEVIKLWSRLLHALLNRESMRIGFMTMIL